MVCESAAIVANEPNAHHLPSLSTTEIERRMENFRRAAFKLFSSRPQMAEDSTPPDASEQVIHVMRSMMELTNGILGPHNASAVLTRTEEDTQWGTQVYVRLACTDEAQEQPLLQTLVAQIKREACLLRPEIVESQLDGTQEVRMRVPSPAYAKRLAWSTQRAQMWKPMTLALGFALTMVATMAYFYRVEHAAHDEL